jgi:ABC-type Na+ efflux pump permease subunit
MAVLTLGGFVAVLIEDASQESWIIWNYVGGLFTLVLYLFAASRACRFLLDARRSGLLELLLATPVNERQIIAGQWRALLSLFGLPLLLLLGAHATGAALSQLGYQRVTSQIATITSSSVTNQSGVATSQTVVVGANAKTSTSVNPATNAAGTRSVFQLGSTVQKTCMAATAAAAAALATLANLLALCWFGMWMGLTSKNANLATLKTLLFVQIIPWFVISFGTSIGAGLLMAVFLANSGQEASGSWFAWWPLLSAVLFAGIVTAKDAAFILWSRGKLLGSLRSRAEQGFDQPRLLTPHRAAPKPGPPVIASI